MSSSHSAAFPLDSSTALCPVPDQSLHLPPGLAVIIIVVVVFGTVALALSGAAATATTAAAAVGGAGLAGVKIVRRLQTVTKSSA